jgi:hypothetical protein
MPEIVGNLHLHTTASDGMETHDRVAAAAIRAGLDFIIYTDHNVWTDGIEGWYRLPGSSRELLRLMGQEVNDEQLKPEKNHLLVFFVCSDLQPAAADPQKLIDTVIEQDGLCFLAHPLERPGLRAAKETFPWVNWEVSGFTGLEIWNAMTDAKWRLRTMPRAIIGAYLPPLVLSMPLPEMLARWDELLAAGQKVVAIGSSDAHGWSFSLGPLRRTVYPYEFLFRAVNTHLLLAEPLVRDPRRARSQIRDALQMGHCFVSYDLIGSSRGFSFTAAGSSQQAGMGDTLVLRDAVTLSISSPERAELCLLQDGRVVTQTTGKTLTWQISSPGVYRVEAYRRFWGQRRGWVFTNPIYLVSEPTPH